MEFVHRGFTRLLGKISTLTKTHAIIEKITGCYVLFLSVHGTSEVNTSDQTRPAVFWEVLLLPREWLTTAERLMAFLSLPPLSTLPCHPAVPVTSLVISLQSCCPLNAPHVLLPGFFKCFYCFHAGESPFVSKSFSLSSEVLLLYLSCLLHPVFVTW